MPAELHLPDLPEVPIAVGGPPPAGRAQRPPLRPALWLAHTLSSYLPLLVMALLALASWWLVKNTPSAPSSPAARAVTHEPDYAMSGFTLERFDAAGRLAVRLEGAQLRHYPDTDRIEVEGLRLRAVAPDGRVLLATARRAQANGDASEVQLLGAAQVDAVDAAGTPLRMRSEFLHAFLVTERVRTHLPVQVTHGATALTAGGLDYDHVARRLDLAAPMRAVFPPTGRR